jgi:hypothetical protein
VETEGKREKRSKNNKKVNVDSRRTIVNGEKVK